jgi:hypothetical protein
VGGAKPMGDGTSAPLVTGVTAAVHRLCVLVRMPVHCVPDP